ncbi:MAG: YgiT-type zinc finger protein [Anaerolineaceae bacterium]|jgi:YgiT-type zinc finger domain-containing protein|nr:YgiT-type zinc finger protein [Anaerolineaceae bacterium]OQY87529.1 MAG: hypothetical protein B6D38_12100 [Anaerolineae bacterium UTCFX1]
MKHETPTAHSFESDRIPCDQCGVGMLRLRRVVYLAWLGEELVTVPNFPARICDVCGRREYDERAIAWLNTLLNPEAGKHSPRLSRTQRPASPKKAHPRPPLE